jgi:membrane protease YdiL (CAAX protease family)
MHVNYAPWSLQKVKPSSKTSSSKFLIVIDLAIIAAIFYLDYMYLLPASKTPYLFLLGWISLLWRGLRWKDIGLRLNQPVLKLFIIGLVVGIGMEALELFATQPLLTQLLHQGLDLAQLKRLIGNLQLLILSIILAWLLAAFGEETVYRGYLTNRVAGIFGESKSP